jgi:hypothetical protein
LALDEVDEVVGFFAAGAQRAVGDFDEEGGRVGEAGRRADADFDAGRCKPL